MTSLLQQTRPRLCLFACCLLAMVAGGCGGSEGGDGAKDASAPANGKASHKSEAAAELAAVQPPLRPLAIRLVKAGYDPYGTATLGPPQAALGVERIQISYFEDTHLAKVIAGRTRALYAGHPEQGRVVLDGHILYWIVEDNRPLFPNERQMFRGVVAVGEGKRG
jgi:hypothetical protein